MAVTRQLSLRDTLIRATRPAALPPALCANSHGRQVPCALLPSLPSHSFSPSGSSGEWVRSLGCAGLAKPATEPHSCSWDPLPARWPLCGRRLRRWRLRRVRVPPDFGSVPSAHSPLRPPDSAAISAHLRSALCLPNRLARSRRTNPAEPIMDVDPPDFRRLRPVDLSARSAGRPAPGGPVRSATERRNGLPDGSPARSVRHRRVRTEQRGGNPSGLGSNEGPAGGT